jgi:hypothetical protein
MTDKREPGGRRPYERCHTDRRFAEWLRTQGLSEDDWWSAATQASAHKGAR